MAELLSRIGRHDVGALDPWRQSLANNRELRRVIKERTPQPSDGAELLSCDRDRAGLASLFDDWKVVEESICYGAGASAAAVLGQARWRAFDDAGIVVLSEPGASAREIPVGYAGMAHPEWVIGFALGAVARDSEALAILCTPKSIEACSLPSERIDPFWPFYCAVLASAAVDRAAISEWIKDAERTIVDFRIAEPALVELRVRPIVALAGAVADGDQPRFAAAIREALTSHQTYYAGPERIHDRAGFLAFEILGLAALAHDRGMAVEIDSDYLPLQLVRGDFSHTLSRVIYKYGQRSIGSAEEAHWFLDLEGFPRSDRSHRLVEVEGRLVARYLAEGAPGIPRAAVDFVLRERDSKGGPPPALDAGQLLALAEGFAGDVPADRESLQEMRSRRARLSEAVSCIDAVLALIPSGKDAVEGSVLVSLVGRKIYESEPGRFRRDRLIAYRSVIEKHVKDLDVQIQRARAGSSSHLTRAQEVDLSSEIEAKSIALSSAELIRIQAMPVLEAIAHDKTGEFISTLSPRAGDCELAFVGDAVEIARRAYAEIWERGLNLKRPTSVQREIRCYVAPAGMLAEENELSRQFPGGYRAIARWLNPHRIWVAWKYVAPGQSSGMAYNGLVWCDDHWAWFPKPYRVLAELSSRSEADVE